MGGDSDPVKTPCLEAMLIFFSCDVGFFWALAGLVFWGFSMVLRQILSFERAQAMLFFALNKFPLLEQSDQIARYRLHDL